MSAPSGRDKEIFLFAALFFYFEFVVHEAIKFIFREPRTKTEVDLKLAIGEFSALPKKDEHVEFFLERIFAVEGVLECLEFLRQDEVASLVQSLFETFRSQEFSDQCEGWSNFDDKTAEDFAFEVASSMLTLLPFAQLDGVNTPVRIRWFENIFNGQERYDILRAAVEQMLAKMRRKNAYLPLLALT